MSLEVVDLEVALGGRPVLRGVSLEATGSSTVAVLGPSGSGKSTLLRVVAGLLRPDGGRVLIGETDVTALPAHRRDVGLMFQDDALFPHRDVAGNVGFGLRMANLPAADIAARVSALLERVDLAGYERRSVASLSGGERKRVALARALAPAPALLLLDEPLGGLDRPLHERLLEELRELFSSLEVTVVLVTHDVEEAFALGDQVAVMRDGRLVQLAPPEALWAAPADEWVARFLGHANIEHRDGLAVVTRPEAIAMLAAPAGEGGAEVIRAERRGPLVRLWARQADGTVIVATSSGVAHPAVGDRVTVQVDPSGVVAVPRRERPHA